MDFDGESLDMLEDVMDVDVGNPLDDSNIMLELNNEGTNDGNYQNRTEENEDEDEEDDDDDDSNSPSAVDGDPNAADKREKSNAKAVECLDLDGNLIEIFKSGLAASVKLNIPQGDISQCCRGLKRSVAGYRFRFHGDTEDRSEFKLKRGYGYVLEPVIPAAKEPQAPAAPTRNTRASRGEYSLNSQVAQERNTDGYKALAAIKVRTSTDSNLFFEISLPALDSPVEARVRRCWPFPDQEMVA